MKLGFAPFAFGVLWLAAAVVGTGVLLNYEFTPGAAPATSSQWPAKSKLKPPSQNTLLMFAHPQCPCTKASVEQLQQLLLFNAGTVDARLVYYHPETPEANWEKSEVLEIAAGIPGLELIADAGGKEADLFGAATSGHVVVYNDKRAKIYSGGITMGRGHAGENPGFASVKALLTGATTPRTNLPVFGCSILRSGADSQVRPLGKSSS